jgi:catechol-2,3-dioxygenase
VLVQRITLRTSRLDEQRAFYARTLGLPLVREDRRSMIFRAGHSELEFVNERTEPAEEARESPRYHFAFNIPENRLDDAKAWLEQRTELLNHRPSGGPVVYFPAWNAHAMYFADPAGNILEFIARHTLGNASDHPFGSGDLLCVSEIGVVTDRIQAAADRIRADLGLREYLGASPGFMPIGDEHGLFIVVETGRMWMPTDDVPAAKAQTAVVVEAPKPGRCLVDGADVTIHAL